MFWQVYRPWSIETLWFASVSASLHACWLFSLPKALAVLWRVVDPLQDFQPVWSSVHTPCRQAIQVGIWGGGKAAFCPLFCRPSFTQRHTPLRPQLSALPHLWARHILCLFHSPSLLLSPPVCCTRAQNTLGELMFQAENGGVCLGGE